MHRADQRTACITGGVHRRSRRWYGPWRCAWCRHRRPSAGPPASAEGSSSVAVPAGSAPSPAPLPCGAAPACAAASASLPSASAPASSRASIAVASREMCSTRWPSIVRAISVSCRRLARRLSANSEKARENVASLGSRPAPLQPHSRHSLPSTSRRSIRPRVVGTSNTALAMKARASAARSSSGRPAWPREVGQKSLDPHQFQNRDEQLVALAHRAKLALEPREQLLLKGVPVIR